jgi:glycine hydroxymethyltransferase
MPWDDVNAAQDPSGVRLGSQELTRLGMKESEMVEVAEIFKHLAIDKKSIGSIKAEVIELRKNFNTIQYCYNTDIPAYKYHNIVPLKK